jgi:DNA primase
MKNQTAEIIKQSLTMRQVAERYGYNPNRAGFIQCPFHPNDDHGSLKLYDDQGGFHCFGCGAGGSVIDFVMKLFGLSFPQALVRLSADFNIPIGGRRTVTTSKLSEFQKQREAERQHRQALEAEYRQMAAEHLYWHQAKILFEPTNPPFIHPLYAEAVKKLPYIDWWLDEHISLEEGGRNGRNTTA